MEVAVWDTHVLREDGLTMHFDILVPSDTDSSKVYQYGRIYLDEKPFETGEINALQCRFCHIEIASNQLKSKIQSNHYHIVEMANCE